MDDYKNILIFGEMGEKHLSPMTTQLIGIGKKLSQDLDEELGVLFLGSQSHCADLAFCYGADHVYTATDPLFKQGGGLYCLTGTRGYVRRWPQRSRSKRPVLLPQR